MGMKKKIKLTESELVGLVKKIINEQEHRDENGELTFQFNDKFVLLRNLGQKKVQHYLSKLPRTVRFLSILDCDGVDFSEIDLCSFPSLITVNVRGTKNNFEETIDCEYHEIMDGLYELIRGDI